MFFDKIGRNVDVVSVCGEAEIGPPQESKTVARIIQEPFGLHESAPDPIKSQDFKDQVVLRTNPGHP